MIISLDITNLKLESNETLESTDYMLKKVGSSAQKFKIPPHMKSFSYMYSDGKHVDFVCEDTLSEF